MIAGKAAQVKIYKYRTKPISVAYAILFIAFLVTGSVPMVIIHSEGLKALPLFAWCVLFLLPVTSVLSALMFFLIWLPVGIGDEGIATFMFGKRRKFLTWTSVAKVERVRFYDSPTMRFRFEFWVHADGTRIRFDDYIDHLDRLVEKLNGYIAEHHIPAFEVDRGRETRRAPVETLADIAQGKGLDGVRAPTAKF